ncbi:MAG TPA: hypothetical protein VJ417_13710, partial [Candidatus Glassbacteria bacterium]|nr:hypothetical protein [Candidatus Glassbacteria bacterium]
TKSQSHTARLQAVLEILPRLVRDLNGLVESFEKESGVRSQKKNLPLQTLAPGRWRKREINSQESERAGVRSQNEKYKARMSSRAQRGTCFFPGF